MLLLFNMFKAFKKRKIKFILITLTIFLIVSIQNLITRQQILAKDEKNFIRLIQETVESTTTQTTTTVEVTAPNRITYDNPRVFPNRRWLFNKNVMQYSSYLFIDSSNNYKFETIVLFDSKDYTDFYADESRLDCLMNILDVKQIIKLKISQVHRFQRHEMVFLCTLPVDFEQESLNMHNIAITIVYKKDFDTNDLKFEYGVKPYNLSYDMIKYQIPEIIHMPVKKKKAIAHCIHYTHDISTTDLKRVTNWLNIQKSIGIEQIVFYDSHPNTWFKEQLLKNFDEPFINVRTYTIHKDEICNMNRILKTNDSTQQNIKNQIDYDMCTHLYFKYFDNPSYDTKNRWTHQGINANDCYRTLSKTYEFVSYFDIDEFILPRQHKLDSFINTHETYKCENLNGFCNLTANTQLQLYDYLISIIKKNSGDDISKVNSLMFKNAVYLIPYITATNVLRKLKFLIEQQQQQDYPVKVKLEMSLYSGHTFLVEQTDLDYIKYLYNSYTEFDCIYRKHVRANGEFDLVNFSRFLYFTTEMNHHMGKSIHYTDNVEIVFTHYPIYPKENTIQLYVPVNDGVLSHFRKDNYYLARNLNSSIRSLQLDFEYFSYFIRNDYSVCSGLIEL